MAHGGLRDVNDLRGLRHAAGLGDGDERPQQSYVDVAPHFPLETFLLDYSNIIRFSSDIRQAIVGLPHNRDQVPETEMPIEIGKIEAIYRYPVKSMRGEHLEAGTMGWHGLDGDRRLAFRRLDQGGGFPWLTASKFPELVLYTPRRPEDGNGAALPTHVLTPEGREMPLFGEDLAAEVGRRYGSPVQMMQLNHGIFDEASISVITTDTVGEVCRLAGKTADVRRFRPNILVRSARAVSFEEDDWVGGVLTFGAAEDAPAVTVTMRDARCVMVTLDPDGGSRAPEVMKAVVRANRNNAGIYSAVTRTGRLAVGQSIFLHR